MSVSFLQSLNHELSSINVWYNSCHVHAEIEAQMRLVRGLKGACSTSWKSGRNDFKRALPFALLFDGLVIREKTHCAGSEMDRMSSIKLTESINSRRVEGRNFRKGSSSFWRIQVARSSEQESDVSNTILQHNSRFIQPITKLMKGSKELGSV